MGAWAWAALAALAVIVLSGCAEIRVGGKEPLPVALENDGTDENALVLLNERP